MDVLFKSKLALQIAGVERQVFLDAVSAGYYLCAPATTPGKARVFSAVDVAILFLFAHVNRHGLTVKEAGALACKVRATFPSQGLPHDLKERPLVVAFRMFTGQVFVQRRGREIPNSLDGVGLTIEAQSFDLENLIAYVHHRADEFRKDPAILGDDE